MIFFYLLVSGMPLVNQALFAHFTSDLTMVKYLGLASLLVACLHLAMRQPPRQPMQWRLAVLFLAFYLLALVSHFTLSLPAPWDMSPFLSLTSFLMLLFIVSALIDTPQRLRWTVLVAIASVGLGSIYMVREWLEFHNVYKDFRPGFVVGDSNYFTLSALLCVPLAYFFLQGRRPWWERAFLIGCILLTVIAVALGASRGGLIGLIGESVFVVLHTRRRVLNFAIVGVLLLAAAAASPISSWDRLMHPTGSDVQAEDNRLIVWHAGYRMIEQHPITGIGLGNFKPMVLTYETEPGRKEQTLAHNTFIEVTAELGVPGLLLFLAILWTAFSLARSARKRIVGSHSVVRLSALGLESGLVGCVLAICFLSAEQQKLLWLMIFLTPCVERLARQEQAAEAPEPVPAAAPARAKRPRAARELAEMFR